MTYGLPCDRVLMLHTLYTLRKYFFFTQSSSTVLHPCDRTVGPISLKCFRMHRYTYYGRICNWHIYLSNVLFARNEFDVNRRFSSAWH